jgi:hypothetical protein
VSSQSLAVRTAWLVAAAVGLWVLALGLIALLGLGGLAIATYAPDYFLAAIAAWGLAAALA